MKKILIVEDEVDLAFTISEHLKTAGYDVFIAEDGVSALDFFKINKADLIVLDLSMPNMDGETFVLVIQSRDELKDVPIVILTATSDEEVRQRYEDIGVNAFLVKPYEAEKLLAKIEELLKGA